MREGVTWRWRPREDGSFEVAAWWDGSSLGIYLVVKGFRPSSPVLRDQGAQSAPVA
jgi:hypothetical protein